MMMVEVVFQLLWVVRFNFKIKVSCKSHKVNSDGLQINFMNDNKRLLVTKFIRK
ncbi:hypothetical protein HanRHA438_Chr03g0123141 [Helianthus annuus]|nr:hypothetical protein HanRHA438_Chr03g0123141 [Helianthus annuus]